MTTKEIIIAAVHNGSLDADLEILINHMRARRDQVIKTKVFTTLTPGTEVTFNDKIRPSRLVGQKAIVERVNRETVVVHLKVPDSRFFGSVKVPMNLLAL